MQYVSVPSELALSDVQSESFCFSPGRYVRFISPRHRGKVDFVPLDKLVVVRNQILRAEKAKWYQYAEIGDIDVDTGGVQFRKMRGFELPTSRPAVAKRGDVLISTVRTYRKGIRYVANDGNNLVTTNAVLNVSDVTEKAKHISLPYVYSFLRTEFFIEQVWSLLHRGVYPRMDTGALHQIRIPVTDDRTTAIYVAKLALAIVDKEIAIRSRNEEIIAAIDAELDDGFVGKSFVYSYPSLDEVRTSSRLDTGLYGQSFRSFRHRVDCYRKGATQR